LDLNPDIEVVPYNEPFTASNAMKIAADYEIIVDCSDNFPTRYLTNDLCVLTGKADIFGAIFRFDGQASVFDARSGPCYRCLFPEPPPPYSVPGCGASGVLGVLPGTIGTIQATEALKIILGVGEPLIGRLMLYSALDMSFDFVRLHKNPACKICGDHPQITGLVDYEGFCGVSVVGERKDTEWDIEPRELEILLKGKRPLRIVDVREPQESEISRIPGSINIPLGQLSRRMRELDPEEDIVVHCKGGVRSVYAAEMLVRAGYKHVRNLKGGINGWVNEVDPDQPLY
jgi:sulfur-carrier protein adenylyltransferase/sulfurtransferase